MVHERWLHTLGEFAHCKWSLIPFTFDQLVFVINRMWQKFQDFRS